MCAKKPLCVLKNEIIEFSGTNFYQDRVDIKLSSNDIKKELLEKFFEFNHFGPFKVENTLDIDGIKFFLAKNVEGGCKDKDIGWVLMRESGTEPLLRFYIEACNKEFLNEIRDFINSNV